MCFKIHQVLILLSTPYVLGDSYTLDGNLNLAPKLSFEYRVGRLNTSDTRETPRERTFTIIEYSKPNKRNRNTPSVIDIVLPDNNKHRDNFKNHSALIFGAHSKKQVKTGTSHKRYVHAIETTKAIEYVASPKGTETTKRPHGVKKNTFTAKHKTVKNKRIRINAKRLVIKNDADDIRDHERISKKDLPKEDNSEYYGKVKGRGKMYVKTRKIKDDPKIKEFTKHVYEQTIKVFESIRNKMTDYRMKKEVENLMRSYDEKLGDFVRVTQKRKIKTRLGGQKVILNTVDTSNRILKRLLNYMMSKMDQQGILRNGPAENVILNEVKQKMELENKHICTKMHICRSADSFSTFVSDILLIILKSSDEKVVLWRDAFTEMMKNTDVSQIFDYDTEKRYYQSIPYVEGYPVGIVRPLLFMLNNLVNFKNFPIKVIGPIDSRVNKTVAYLEVLDIWENKIPSNEQNVLVWNDIMNSMKEWSEGKRNDIEDLVQAFVDHVMKVVRKFDANDMSNIAKNFKIILGP